MYPCDVYTHKTTSSWGSTTEEKPQIVFLSRTITPRWRLNIQVYLGVFLEGRGLMRRGMMEFANHPALHFSLPWFSIPPSACSSKTSSSFSSLSTRSFPVRVHGVSLCVSRRPRPRLSLFSSPHSIYLTSWYLFLVSLSSYLTTYFKCYVCPTSALRYYSSVFLFLPFLFFFVCFIVHPRHLFIINPSHLPSATNVARPEPLFLFLSLSLSLSPPLSLSLSHSLLLYFYSSPLLTPSNSLHGLLLGNHWRYSRLVRDLSELRAFHTPSSTVARAKARARVLVNPGWF